MACVAQILVVALLVSFVLKQDPDVSKYEKQYGQMGSVDADSQYYVHLNAGPHSFAQLIKLNAINYI